jgi:plastocyanin
MRGRWTTVAMAIGFALATVGSARAEAKVTVTREENKPSTVEVKAGESVWFVNASGGVAHVSFGDSPIQFMVGRGDSSVKFTEPGTYKYYVHISGVKGHAHSGNVVVK